MTVEQAMQTLRAAAPFLAGTAAALLAHRLAGLVELELSRLGGGVQRRVTRLAGGPPEPSLADRLGDQLLARAGLDPAGWERRLRWAQLGGYCRGWTVGGMVGRGALLAAAGLAAAPALGGTVYWAMAPALLALPFLQVRSRARRVQAEVRRALPETATLVAAEMAAGNPPDQALARAAELPGVLGRLLARALSESRAAGRPLFSRDRQARGALVETLAPLGMPELAAFASQVDLAAAKGAAGPQLMADIAASLAREHRMRVMQAAEQLESDLVIPATLFFFLPFVAAVMIPLLLPLLQAF